METTLHGHKPLGCRPPKPGVILPTLADYRRVRATPPPPAERDWTPPGITWGAMNNLTVGCCTCSGLGHAVQTWSGAAWGPGGVRTMTDPQVLNVYITLSGFNPITLANDTGISEIDLFNFWATHGVVTSDQAPDVLVAWAAIDPHDPTAMRQAIEEGVGIYTVWGLPNAWQNATVWGAVPSGGADGKIGSWGEHATWTPGYKRGQFKTITWGQEQPVTDDGLEYCRRAYVLLDRDVLNLHGRDPHGLDIPSLRTDMLRLAEAA